ncbi:hypothetical protein LTR70_005993 [Exophiala xenobiotica]|uniref:Uncharacterized protein n=1 Tax=Lithohypha guttulata TaxID=1690604 RepID=A0ABR0JZ35_9EURO|nr:hypothetical protein LTR24_009047 [Lithohypha guttulata]KAK5317252.1 hypothetical protein LTR70_005993 [Exophiala xenobiotica]
MDHRIGLLTEQQQGVRSLQAALQEPIEIREQVQPILPPQFQNVNNDAQVLVEDDNDTSSILVDAVLDQEAAQIALSQEASQASDSTSEATHELSPQKLWYAHVDNTSPNSSPSAQNTVIEPSVRQNQLLYGRFAYVLSFPKPSDLCSGLLFTKWHRQLSQLPSSQVDILYLYPSDWETSSYAPHRDALRLLLESEHRHSAILHPVPISKVWTGMDVEAQLLSELARNIWPYERLLYLRTPGMLIDTIRLDNTLTSTYVDRKLLKSSWARLRAPVRRGDTAALNPEVLLFAQGKGLMVPTGDLQRTLTAKAKTSHEGNQQDGGNDEFLPKEAAYVLFDEKELEQRKWNDSNHDSIFERFERERELVCEGTDLLA